MLIFPHKFIVNEQDPLVFIFLPVKYLDFYFFSPHVFGKTIGFCGKY